MKRLFAATAALLLAACGAGRPRGPMSDGERLYLAKCTSCHSAFEPVSHTPAQWRTEVAEMEGANKVTLTREERALILGYLTGEKVAAAR